MILIYNNLLFFFLCLSCFTEYVTSCFLWSLKLSHFGYFMFFFLLFFFFCFFFFFFFCFFFVFFFLVCSSLREGFHWGGFGVCTLYIQHGSHKSVEFSKLCILMIYPGWLISHIICCNFSLLNSWLWLLRYKGAILSWLILLVWC